jgi:coenzyme F420-reducing hydrogenase beta subunit
MNISNIHDCYGCGVCTTVCKKRIIEIRLNNDGFYEPCITDETLCTDCGLCREVCAFSHDEVAKASDVTEMSTYGSWSNEEAVRRKCSSGGTGFEIGRLLIEKGYRAVGVRYNATQQRAEHYIATTVSEFIQSTGSKYIQSYTEEAFQHIDRHAKYLVSGTPCQIDSFRLYIRKFHCEDNFVLLDFFCHGVPSMLLWKKYLTMMEKKCGKISYVSWRNKRTGWHDSWAMGFDKEEHLKDKVEWHDSYNLLIREKKHFLNSRLSQGDFFFQMFLGDYCLSKSCYERCKYKIASSAADLRIGDMWGSVYKENEDGVTALLAFTEKGKAIVKELEEKKVCTIKEHTLNEVAEGQMTSAPTVNKFVRKLVFVTLRSALPIQVSLNIFRVNRKLRKIFKCSKT